MRGVSPIPPRTYFIYSSHLLGVPLSWMSRGGLHTPPLIGWSVIVWSKSKYKKSPFFSVRRSLHFFDLFNFSSPLIIFTFTKKKFNSDPSITPHIPITATAEPTAISSLPPPEHSNNMAFLSRCRSFVSRKRMLEAGFDGDSWGGGGG